jgi:hypothetical protein
MSRSLEDVANDLKELSNDLERASKDEKVIIARKCEPYAEELGIYRFTLLEIVELPIKLVLSIAKEGEIHDLQVIIARKCFALHQIIGVMEKHNQISKEDAVIARRQIFDSLLETVNSSIFQTARKTLKTGESKLKKAIHSAATVATEQLSSLSSGSDLDLKPSLALFSVDDKFKRLTEESKESKKDAINSMKILYYSNKIHGILTRKHQFAESKCMHYQKGVSLALRDIKFQQELSAELSYLIACDMPFSTILAIDVSHDKLQPLKWKAQTFKEYESDIVKSENQSLDKLSKIMEKLMAGQFKDLLCVDLAIVKLSKLQLEFMKVLQSIDIKEMKSKSGSNYQPDRLMLAKARKKAMAGITSCDLNIDILGKKVSKLDKLVEQCRKVMGEVSAKVGSSHLLSRDCLTQNQSIMIHKREALRKLISCVSGYDAKFNSDDKTIFEKDKKIRGLLHIYNKITGIDPLEKLEESLTRQRSHTF